MAGLHPLWTLPLPGYNRAGEFLVGSSSPGLRRRRVDPRILDAVKALNIRYVITGTAPWCAVSLMQTG